MQLNNKGIVIFVSGNHMRQVEPLTVFFFKSYFNYTRDWDTKREHPSAGSLPQIPAMVQAWPAAAAGIQGLHPCGRQKPNHLSHHCCFPGLPLMGSWSLDAAQARHLSQVLGCELGDIGGVGRSSPVSQQPGQIPAMFYIFQINERKPEGISGSWWECSWAQWTYACRHPIERGEYVCALCVLI